MTAGHRVPGFISAGSFAFTLSQIEFLYARIFLTKTTTRAVPVGVIAELIPGLYVRLGCSGPGGKRREPASRNPETGWENYRI